MLADLLGPTAALTSFLEDATNLLNGLLSQVPKALYAASETALGIGGPYGAVVVTGGRRVRVSLPGHD
jgi:hypothetical protein